MDGGVATSTRSVKVYVAGAMMDIDQKGLSTVPAWRSDIFGTDQFEPDYEQVRDGQFHYVGPTLRVRDDQVEIDPDLICEELKAADVVFAWIDRTDMLFAQIDVAVALALDTPVFIAVAEPGLQSHFQQSHYAPYDIRVMTDAVAAWRTFKNEMAAKGR